MENSPTSPPTEQAAQDSGYSLLSLLFLVATAGVILALVRSAFDQVDWQQWPRKLQIWPDTLTIFNLAFGFHIGLVVGAILGFSHLRSFWGIVIGCGTGATLGMVLGWVLVAGANGRVYLGGCLFLLVMATVIAKLITRVERT